MVQILISAIIHQITRIKIKTRYQAVKKIKMMAKELIINIMREIVPVLFSNEMNKKLNKNNLKKQNQIIKIKMFHLT